MGLIARAHGYGRRCGRNLLSREGCVHCHTVKLSDGGVMKATDDPPSLSHIADKTTREWVYAWLKDPQAYSTTSTMPNFKLGDDDARDISAFLIANSTPVPGDTATLAAKASADPAAGASLYGESFCASCHAVQNAAGNMVGGDIGPELTRVGSKVKPEWLQAWLRNPRAYDPGTAMPHYRLTDPQVATLSGFLLAKADSDLLANVHLEAAKKPENFAPELSRIGSKPVTQLAFLPGMQHTLPDYPQPAGAGKNRSVVSAHVTERGGTAASAVQPNAVRQSDYERRRESHSPRREGFSIPQPSAPDKARPVRPHARQSMEYGQPVSPTQIGSLPSRSSRH
jgi:cbb3-type cytochrome oxidase cytochrome c subunit